MKKYSTLLIVLITFIVNNLNAQVFEVDTLQYNGDETKYINLVIMGDGYTSSEQEDFIVDAQNLSTYVLSQAPFSNYLKYFNVFAIKVISAETGAKHPNNATDCNTASPAVPVSNPSTYLGCTFDYFGIHRLIVPLNNSNIINVLANNFPNYDQVLIVANTPYYGGSGGAYSTSTNGPSSFEVTSHEVGHSFAALKDEYYPGDSYASENNNMTQQTNPNLVKWKNWVGLNGVGIYQHCCGGNSGNWYRPHQNCKMRFLGVDFCRVCSQTIIESVHNRVDPIVSYLPTNSIVNSSNRFLDFKLTEIMKPLPNTLKTIWELDGLQIGKNVDSVKIDQNNLSIGSHILSMDMVDTTALVKIDNHETLHISSISLTINKTTTGINMEIDKNRIAISVFPNPVNDVLNVSIDVEKPSPNTLEIVSLNGSLVFATKSKGLVKGLNQEIVNIENLEPGTYFLRSKIGKYQNSLKFIKQ